MTTLGLGLAFFTTFGVTTVMPFGATFLASPSVAPGLAGAAALAGVELAAAMGAGFFAGTDFAGGGFTLFGAFLGGCFFAAALADFAAGFAGGFETFLALLAALAMSTVLMTPARAHGGTGPRLSTASQAVAGRKGQRVYGHLREGSKGRHEPSANNPLK